MITTEQAIAIHSALIERFGGLDGIRDKPALESALARPFQTFDQEELYPTIEEKAAAILESLAINHPFMDGNKRIAYTLFRILLLQNGVDINASEDDKYALVIGVSKGEIKYQDILAWTVRHKIFRY